MPDKDTPFSGEIFIKLPGSTEFKPWEEIKESTLTQKVPIENPTPIETYFFSANIEIRPSRCRKPLRKYKHRWQKKWNNRLKRQFKKLVK